jgi:hypothetical protein
MWKQTARSAVLVLCSILGCMACARTSALEGPPQDLQALYQDALHLPPPAPALQTKGLPVGPEVPYTPIMQPPQVQRVWVPDHLNAEGDLVSGHWVYVLLEPAKWFLETYPLSPTPTLRTPLAPPVSPPVASTPLTVPVPGSVPGTPANAAGSSVGTGTGAGSPGAIPGQRSAPAAAPQHSRRKGTP